MKSGRYERHASLCADKMHKAGSLKTVHHLFHLPHFQSSCSNCCRAQRAFLSNGSVLERIWFDLQCKTELISAVSPFRYLKVDHIQWLGFSRLQLLEVKVYMFMSSKGFLTGELNWDIHKMFRRAMNRSDVEVRLNRINFDFISIACG